ncbi:MAG: FecR domain-containing protein [Verrucomicrobiota bacterium]
MKEQARWHHLIAIYQTGQISDEELAELESLLRESSEPRELFRRSCRIDSQLQRETESLTSTGEEVSDSPLAFSVPARRRFSLLDASLSAAVVALLAVMATFWLTKPRIVATIVATENASWESTLPTAPGSDLVPGDMKLTSGLAKIEFRSGAEMTLEAPAEISLETAMRARLSAGAAVMEVPESAIGFVLETPDGKVIDHGTSFAVNVNEGNQRSTFEVIEGEISIQPESGGEEMWLVENEGAMIDQGVLSAFDGAIPEEFRGGEERVLRIGTGGRSYSVIRANRLKWLHPDKLTVKRKTEPSNHERRSFLSFDLAGVDLDSVASARIRLNQVPSGIGFASRLPKISDIAVYGLTNQEKSDWVMGTTWEEGPSAADGVLLGHIEIPRSLQRGSRFFEGEELFRFLKQNRDGEVTFILDGEVDPVTGARVPSLVLAFASDTHPEAAGPILELFLKSETP